METEPGVYLWQLLELVARWGVTPQMMLEGLALTEAELAQPELRVPSATLRALVDRAFELTGEPGLGFCMGMQLGLASHGHLGFAAMSAPTLREAIQLAERFFGTRTQAVALRAHQEGQTALITLEERVELDDRLREFLVVTVFITVARAGALILGRPITGEGRCTFAEPAHFQRFASLLPGPVVFGRPRNELAFDAALLDAPLVQADPVATQLARAQCERELEAIRRGASRSGQVAALLPRAEGGFHTLEEVARRLRCSPRSLKRHLAQEGRSFSELLDKARRDEALRLLQGTEQSIEQIAEALGYSDAANFTRAFRRWTKETPSQARQRRAALIDPPEG